MDFLHADLIHVDPLKLWNVESIGALNTCSSLKPWMRPSCLEIINSWGKVFDEKWYVTLNEVLIKKVSC